MKCSLIAVVFLLITMFQFANADGTPVGQFSEGGQLYSIQLPQDLDVYPNAPVQSYMFLVDYNSKGQVIHVEPRRSNKVKASKNVEKLVAAIQLWRVTPLKMNGVLLKKWGCYYTVTITAKEESEGGSVIHVSDNGANTVFESVLPSVKTRKLTLEELKLFHKKDPEPKFRKGGLLPELIK
ncbi:hypothetical protein HW115_19475 [Verrucomicrobiaceae bacterium N1E253]|uniref:Uncharacterized protein n=1 Tax=Oceaniferula marina TaxID=2748318 RepID=A0A851GL01_9BACT|nr:hypothetical protein [Oceaniferula marina]NWK57809.1 hypothetical protein [Oceaniferula marina]